jgi:uncharacterized membrane protein
MRLIWIFSALFLCGYLFTESWASEPPPSNEMDQLLKKIHQNTQAVGQATQAAHEVSEKMVEVKVQEKEQLKEAVVVAEAKVEQMAVIQEVYVSKMMAVGLDTAVFVVDEGKNAGPIFDAFLEYQKNGGTEDFNWFRLYIYK